MTLRSAPVTGAGAGAGARPVGARSSRPRQIGGPAAWVTRVRGISSASLITGLVAALCVFGTVMVGSASEVVSIETYGSTWAILIRQCIWLVLGAVVMSVIARSDYRRLGRLATPLLVLGFAGLVLVLVPHLGVKVTGSTRWLGFGSFDVQPSELMKLALVVFGADLVARREESGASERAIVRPLLLVTAAAAGLIILQPDMGTTVVVVCIVLALLVASGVGLRPIAKAGAVVLALGVVVALIDPYRRERILSAFNPGAHAAGSGYQAVQSLIGLGSGGLFGVGLGASAEKWGYLPNAHTDFIFSVIGNELGLVGALGVLALLGALCWFGLRTALRAQDRFGSLLAVAVVAWISAETVINVGAVIGLLPVTGIPLPFISYGGSSLVVTLAGAGLLVSVARQEPRLGPVGGARAGGGRSPAG